MNFITNHTIYTDVLHVAYHVNQWNHHIKPFTVDIE